MAVVNPRFHDVEVIQVQIVNPSASTVTFKDSYTSANSDYGGRIEETNSKNPEAILNEAIETSHEAYCPTTDTIRQNSAVKFAGETVASRGESRDERRTGNNSHSSTPHPKYYEVSPGTIISDTPPKRYNKDKSDDVNYYYSNKRAATVPRVTRSRLWTSHKSVSSRTLSGNSLWHRRQAIRDQPPPKPNHFIKMPFKQAPAVTLERDFKLEDDLMLPGIALRATTALHVSRIRSAFKRLPLPSADMANSGRLLRGRLLPLRPVKGLHTNDNVIKRCQGIQPENRREQRDSPSPTLMKYLKEQYNEVCRMHKERRSRGGGRADEVQGESSPSQSIHPTSPRLDNDDDDNPQPVNFDEIYQEPHGEVKVVYAPNHVENTVIF